MIVMISLLIASSGTEGSCDAQAQIGGIYRDTAGVFDRGGKHLTSEGKEMKVVPLLTSKPPI